jgi:hypothetical protein
MEPGLAQAFAIKQCSACSYCLEDLGADGTRVRCPECGLEQLPKTVKGFPGFRRAVWDAVRPTMLAYTLCLALFVGAALGSSLLTATMAVFTGFVAFLAAIVMPVEMYTSISAECDLSKAPFGWGFTVVVGGWAANSVMAVLYLVAANVGFSLL